MSSKSKKWEEIWRKERTSAVAFTEIPATREKERIVDFLLKSEGNRRVLEK